MKTAFSYWQTRIAPVFDTADNLRLIEDGTGAAADLATDESLAGSSGARRALRLAELGVAVLVCGAISRTLHEQVAAHGIRVVPFVAGELAEVMQAWQTGKLSDRAFAMPGCCGGGGRRRQRGGRGMGGRGNCAAPGVCRCPRCGQRLAYQAGIPCAQQACPRCGTTMVARE